MFEVVAGFDLATDLLFVQQLFESDVPHNMWLVLTLYTMVSPYLVCAIPYVDY